MIGAVWWTCALFALASARVYDRCELARELYRYGIDPENIPTWVCIAYHESRFDTAANNPYSGDHGIFQISELYWCGAGKACGVTCDKFRDADINDDIDCVLQIYEEHSRFQGNGFLAWVVYPQHCTHNTKKYVVDCDYRLKDSPGNKLRSYYELDEYNASRGLFNYTQVEDLVPTYLSIANLLRGKYGKVNYNQDRTENWLNFKLDNIDDLKLPVAGQLYVPPADLNFVTPSSTTSPSTVKTSTTYIPKIKTWRYIESNQFRRPMKSEQKAESTIEQGSFIYTETPINAVTPNTTTSTTTTLPTSRFVISTASSTTPSSTTTSIKPSTDRTWPTWATRKPTIKFIQPSSTSTSTSRPSTTWTLWTKQGTQSTTSSPWNLSKSWVTSSTQSVAITTANSTTINPWNAWSKTITTNQPMSPSTVTLKPWKSSWVWTTPASQVTSTTTTPSVSWTLRPWRTISSLGTTKKPYSPVTRSTTSRATSKLSTRTDTPQFATTTSIQPSTSRSLTRGFIRFSDNSDTGRATALKIKPTSSPTASTTQSIFDLYLKPTQQPKLPVYEFPPKNNLVKLRIFSDGTTTQKPLRSTDVTVINKRQRLETQ